MGHILDILENWFKEDDWNFDKNEERSYLTMGFSGDNGKLTVFARSREEQAQAIIYSLAPVKCPEEKRLQMAEFITRANYGMFIGNFEMDFSDGELRYKTSVDVEEAELTGPMIKHLVYANVLTMDRYLPGILGIAFGDLSPTQAVQKIEGDS